MMRGMRALLGICVFVIAGLVALSTLSSGPPTSTALHSLVTQTHHQLNQLHKLKEELEGDHPLDNTVLTELGFVDNPVVFPNHSWSNVSSPVIVSAVTSAQVGLISEVIRVAQVLSANASLVIYTLDLGEQEMKEVWSECNETCVVIPFDFSPFPSHVRDFRVGAYRSIIIQEMLERSGMVFWLDPCMQVLEKAPPPQQGALDRRSLLDQWVPRALRSGGVLAWPLASAAPHLPTAALTHPDMFPAFRTYKHNYDFQKMSDPKATLIINTPIIHRRLMRPWVSCSLTSSCLSPIGAQDTGCKYNKKPLFRYSGCHLYDISAFNIGLGLAFGMDNDSYLDPSSATFVCSSNSGRATQPSLPPPNNNNDASSASDASYVGSHYLGFRHGHLSLTPRGGASDPQPPPPSPPQQVQGGKREKVEELAALHANSSSPSFAYREYGLLVGVNKTSGGVEGSGDPNFSELGGEKEALELIGKRSVRGVQRRDAVAKGGANLGRSLVGKLSKRGRRRR